MTFLDNLFCVVCLHQSGEFSYIPAWARSVESFNTTQKNLKIPKKLWGVWRCDFSVWGLLGLKLELQFSVGVGIGWGGIWFGDVVGAAALTAGEQMTAKACIFPPMKVEKGSWVWFLLCIFLVPESSGLFRECSRPVIFADLDRWC